MCGPVSKFSAATAWRGSPAGSYLIDHGNEADRTGKDGDLSHDGEGSFGFSARYARKRPSLCSSNGLRAGSGGRI